MDKGQGETTEGEQGAGRDKRRRLRGQGEEISDGQVQRSETPEREHKDRARQCGEDNGKE